MARRMDRLKPAWLEGYDRKGLASDLVAGTVLSALLIPQAMAYAQLAGLPPEAGLYTAIAPAFVYALIGANAFVSMGPVALASLLVADAIEGAGVSPASAAAIVAVETGIILAIVGALGMGRLVNFVSEPALIGFTTAAAILIATSQIPAVLGVDIARAGNLVDAVRGLVAADAVHWPTAAIAAGTLAALVLADRYAAVVLWRLGVHPPYRLALVKSFPLVAILAATGAATLIGDGVARIDPPTGALPSFGVDVTVPAAWIALALPSAIIAIIVFVTGTAVAKALASRRRQSVDTNREAIAIGAACIAAGLTGGYAAGVSLSRSALVFDSGGRSPLATAVAGLIVVPVLLFAAPLLAHLPEAALAALVMSAVLSLVSLDDIASVWRHSRAETAVLAVTLAGTLLLGVREGLVAGAGAGIVAFLWFSSLPRISRVGSTGLPGIYRTVDREDIEVDTLPVLVIRIDMSLYFANVAYCEEKLQELVARHRDAGCLLFDMRAVNGIDASGIRMLDRLIEGLKEQGLRVGFAVVHKPVEEALKSARHVRKAPVYLTLEEGVEKMREICETPAS